MSSLKMFSYVTAVEFDKPVSPTKLLSGDRVRGRPDQTHLTLHHILAFIHEALFSTKCGELFGIDVILSVRIVIDITYKLIIKVVFHNRFAPTVTFTEANVCAYARIPRIQAARICRYRGHCRGIFWDRQKSVSRRKSRPFLTESCRSCTHRHWS